MSWFRLQLAVLGQFAAAQRTMSTRRFSEVRRRTGAGPADSGDEVEGTDLGDDRTNLGLDPPS